MKKLALLRWSPLIGLAIGLMLAATLAIYVNRQNKTELEGAFQLLTQRATLQLERRIQLYEYGLRGTRGAVIVVGEDRLSRERYALYSASRDYANEFPGARGFGFIRRVPAGGEAAFEQAAKADGWPDFEIHQLSPNTGERFVIQYIEPIAENVAAVGLDMASESNRRNAALRALRSGRAAMTDPITLIRTEDRANQGFVVFLPIYRAGAPLDSEAQREAAGYGWAFVVLSIKDVLKDFDFYDGRFALALDTVDEAGKSIRFYASDQLSIKDPVLRRVALPIQVFGKTWMVTMQARPALAEHLNLSSPWLVFGFVLLLSLVGTIATYMLQLANARVEHAQAEGKLNESNRRYRELIDGVKDYAITQLDANGRVIGWNSGAERIKGYSASEILGKHVSVFYPPDQVDLPSLEQKLATAREKGFMHEEGWRRRKDGSCFWASVTVTPMYDQEHRFSGYSKITRDLSERREQELALNRLLGLQRAILNSAGIAIVATGQDGLITLFNARAELLLGYRSDEVIGKLTPVAFHDPQELAARAQALSGEMGGGPIEPGLAVLTARAAHGEVDTHEWTYVAKDGQRKPVLLSFTGILDEHGAPLGFVGLAADLSDQKRYEAELEVARETAERANLAKSSFLANMSHEIRTPMNAILGMTQLVLQGKLEPSQRQLLEKAFSASKALLSILNDVLDYSKVESGHMQLEVRELSLETLLANSASLFAHQAAEKGLELILDIPPDLPAVVLGDPLRLTQVLSNLLSNAVKFTPHGSVTLSVGVLDRSDQACRVRFTVADSGIGMNPSQVAQLFKPFTQADVSVTREYGGTGLGLSICKRLVELMGGEIDVRSAPGAGSAFVFHIRMPLANVPDGRHSASRRLPFQRALVVDDQVAAAHVLQMMLRSWGIDAICADSGAVALGLVQSAVSSAQPFDLLLVDWQMPEMDGLELIERVTEVVSSDQLARIPTMMMVSAYARAELLQRIEGHRIDALLTKPVLPSALHNALANVTHAASGAMVEEPASPHEFPDYVAAAAPLHGKHVLLAEDNEVNQQVATAFLQSAGMEVSIACNGLKAVELARSGRFSAILMDMHMPEMDGLEATRQIRAISACASVPIIAMTAAVMQQDQKACFDAGMNGFVGKPIDPYELISALLRWTDSGAGTLPPTSSALRVHGEPDRTGPTRDVEGVDVRGAVARMGGNRELARRLLQDFALRAPSLADELSTIALPELPFWTHKLKGETANLGLTGLESLCRTMEGEIQARPDTWPTDAANALERALKGAPARISRAVDESLSPPDAAGVNLADQTHITEINDLLESLPALLQNQRIQAIKKSERLHDLLEGTQWHAQYGTIHAQISQLHFSAAMVAFQDFSESFGNLHRGEVS